MQIKDGFNYKQKIALVVDAFKNFIWPLAVGGFAFGVWLAQQQASLLSLQLCLSLGVGSVLFTVLLYGLSQKYSSKRLTLLMLLIAIILMIPIGFFWASIFGAQAISHSLSQEDEGRDLRMTGIVSSLPTVIDRGLRFDFLVEQCAGCSVEGEKISLGWFTQPNADMLQEIPVLKPGQRWQLTARLKQRHGVLNPYGFDTELWLVEQAIAASGSVRPARLTQEHELLAESQGNFWVMIERLREATRSRMLLAAADAPRLNVLLALSIGDQRAIPGNEWALYNATGIGHLLSISGLHITLFAVLVGTIVRFLWSRSRRLMHYLPSFTVAAWLGFLAATFYAVVSGWQVPAQRTVLMLAVVVLARSLAYRPHPAHVLATAAVVVLIADPFAVLSPGAWFSFAAVAILILSGWKTEREALRLLALNDSLQPAAIRTKWQNTLYIARETLGKASRMQIAVTIGMVPWSVLFFSQLSLVSPFANALAIPWISFLVTPLALAGAVLVWIWPPLGGLVLMLGGWLMGAIDLVLQAIGQWPWATLALPAPAPTAFLAAVLGALLLIVGRSYGYLLAVVLMLPLLFSPAHAPAPGRWRVTFIDIGQGMAVLIQTHKHAWLYDTGPQYGPETDGGQRIILPLLRALGVKHLDGIIVSHADNDHSGGALSILKSVSASWLLSTVEAGHPLYQAKVSKLACAKGMSWKVQNLHFTTLHPPTEWLSLKAFKPNALSCTVRISDGSNSVLLPGDLEALQEALLVEQQAEQLPATVLLAPHHGSKTSSTAAFIKAVAPQYVIFQAGYRNRFGHPRPEVLARYQQVNIQILRSDFAGAIVFEFEMGKTAPVLVKPWRQAMQRYWHWREKPS